MDKLFMSNGFRVELISDEGIAQNEGEEFTPRHSTNMLFVAEQLRFSDDQVRHRMYSFSYMGTFTPPYREV